MIRASTFDFALGAEAGVGVLGLGGIGVAWTVVDDAGDDAGDVGDVAALADAGNGFSGSARGVSLRGATAGGTGFAVE